MARSSSSTILTSLLSTISLIGDQPASQEPSLTSSAAFIASDGNLGSLRNVFLTFHFLFPHELLPALDLLDRRLVKRLVTRQSQWTGAATRTQGPIIDANTGETVESNLHQTQHDTRTIQQSDETNTDIPEAALGAFYIQSASTVQDSKSSRSHGTSHFKNVLRGNTAKVFYEVRLDGWNCNCPAFAQSQLKVLLSHSVRANIQELHTPETMNATKKMKLDQGDGNSTVVQPNKNQPVRNALFGGSVTNSTLPIPICKHILAAAIATAAPETFAKNIEAVSPSLNELCGWVAGWGEI